MKNSSLKKYISFVLSFLVISGALTINAFAEGTADCLNHGVETYTETKVYTAATCEATEVLADYIYCEACDELISVGNYQVGKPALGHDYAAAVTKEATCKEEGVTTYTCKNNPSHVFTTPIEMKDHVDADDNGYCDNCGDNVCEHAKTVIINVNQVTCTIDGYTGDTACAKCGVIFKYGNTIYAEGHDFNTMPIDIIPATCTSKRLYVYKCRICSDNVNVVDEASSKLEHQMIVVEDIEPTCVKPGYFSYFCTLCSTTIVANEIPATGRTDENADGKCDIFGCGGKILDPNIPEKCTCMCHEESGFKQFIFKILNTIYKLLKISQECDCGVLHY